MVYEKQNININGCVMHMELGHSVDEWNELYGENNDTFWDILFEEFLTEAVLVDENMLYWYIDGRCYETDKDIDERFVYVVKSVNTNELGVMTDDKGVGVFYTHKDAKDCFDNIVKDLTDLYKECGYNIENWSADDDEFYARYYVTNSFEEKVLYTDFVSIYKCKFGKWN